MRRLRRVPNELIQKILEAGVCAPSGVNMQHWRFLVIRDPKVKETVEALYKRAWDEQVAPRYRSGEPAPGISRERFLRLLDAAEYLAAHIHEAPVWIIPCLEGGTPTRTTGSSIYPGVQIMLLAARALGLGATLTTLYLQFEEHSEAVLGLPPNVHSYALLPIAYPVAGSGQSAASLSQMSSTKIGGASLTDIRVGQHRMVGSAGCYTLGAPTLTAHRNATLFNAKGRTGLCLAALS
jgi:nitroreductase